MLRNTSIILLLLATSAAMGQNKFTKYVGSIKTGYAPTTLAADSKGRLFYGTFNHTPNLYSHIRMIADPVGSIGSTDETGTTIALMAGKISNNGRGIQSMDFASDDTLFVGGDPGASSGCIFRYDYTPEGVTEYTENTAFTAAVKAARSARRSGVSIVSEAGAGLLITNGFASATSSYIDYFDFSGNAVGARIADPLGYHRDIQYIATHNVAYPFRNGSDSPAIINNYLTGINTATGGGTLVSAPIVPDGGTDNSLGHSMQGGDYYVAQNQLFVVDAVTVADPNADVRVFDIKDNGTSVSLAYRITGPSPEQPFGRVYDTTIIGDYLYVCGYEQAPADIYPTSKIYVFTVPPANVEKWTKY